MNLSNKQISALVKEIHPLVKEAQKVQLDNIEKYHKESIIAYVDTIDLGNINWDIIDSATFLLDNISFEGYELKKSSYILTLTIKKDYKDTIVTHILGKTIRNKFIAETGTEEIMKEDIEHDIILSTIGSSTIDEIIESIKKKYSI